MSAAVSLEGEVPAPAPAPPPPPPPEMTFEHSATIDKIAGALAKAQGAMSGAKKDKTGNVVKDGRVLYTYGYATLGSVLEAVREPLSKNGLAVVQTTGQVRGAGVCVLTMLVHESGEWFRGRLWLPVRQGRDQHGNALPPDAQSIGSALTYARRYALSAIVGIAPDDADDDADDDANAALGGEQAPAASSAPPTPRAATPRGPAASTSSRPVPSPAAPAADAPIVLATPLIEDGIDHPKMSDLENRAKKKYGPEFDALKNAPDFSRLRTRCVQEVGGADRAGPEFRAWYAAKCQATSARLGVRPGPAKAAAPAATSGASSQAKAVH